MKQIKARGWHVSQKKMYSAEEMGRDQLTISADGRGFVNVSGSDTQKSVFFYDAFIPLLFTGFSDKHNKEMYDGDIIRFVNSMISSNDPMPGIRIIVWDEEIAGFAHAYVNGDTATSGYVWCKSNAERMFEVIGNIYENPELIKVDDA